MDGLVSLLAREGLAALRRPAPPDRERLARMRLAGTARVGPVTFIDLMTRYGSAEAALAALPDLARSAGLAQAPRIPDRAEIERKIDLLARRGGWHLVWGDADYPACLAALADPPPVLRCHGQRALLHRPKIAVVGARNASGNGRRLAGEFARAFGAAGQIVVSGLARGIDTAAHLGALDSGTLAVLAGGIDIIYPPENADLHRQIAERGLLVSEMPLGTTPQARHFPRRNRIIAGLSAGVVVIEAALQSGSLITAHCAAEQGREVFAVPGSPLDPRSRGGNRLLRDGAHLVECADDVLTLLEPAPPPVPCKNAVSDNRAAVSFLPHPAPHSGSGSPRNGPRPGPPEPTHDIDIKQHSTPDHLRDRIVECLGPAPTPVDELVRRCQVSAAAVQAVLLEIELDGRLERHRGNAVSLL